MSNKVMAILLMITLSVTGFCWGVFYERAAYEPQYVEVEIPVTKTETVNHYIDVPFEVIREIKVEKPIELREFASLEEFTDWLAWDRTDGKHIIFKLTEGGTTISLDGKETPNVWEDPNFQDCDDYAAALQKAAAKDGFTINIQLDTKKMHAINSVFIDNDIYFVEPQTDEVWFAYHRDDE